MILGAAGTVMAMLIAEQLLWKPMRDRRATSTTLIIRPLAKVAIASLQQVTERGVEVSSLLAHYQQRYELAHQYVDAYRLLLCGKSMNVSLEF